MTFGWIILGCNLNLHGFAMLKELYLVNLHGLDNLYGSVWLYLNDVLN